jgi:hypothetical protein
MATRNTSGGNTTKGLKISRRAFTVRDRRNFHHFRLALREPAFQFNPLISSGRYLLIIWVAGFQFLAFSLHGLATLTVELLR